MSNKSPIILNLWSLLFGFGAAIMVVYYLFSRILDIPETVAFILAIAAVVELKAYAPLVSIGGYLVVEDTHVGGDWGKPFGPGKAVQTFLEEDSRFEVDPAREKFLITFNHNGYLKRVR